MTSPRGKRTTPACHSSKKVNRAEQLTYLSINIKACVIIGFSSQSFHEVVDELVPLGGLVQVGRVPGLGQLLRLSGRGDLLQVLLRLPAQPIVVFTVDDLKQAPYLQVARASRGQCYKAFYGRDLRIFVLS